MRYYFLALLLLLGACGEPRPVEVSAPTEAGVRVEPGVSIELAEMRAATLSDIHYDLAFRVPAEASEPISANETVSFELKTAGEDLQLDFREAGANITSLRVNGMATEIIHSDEHLVLPGEALQVGANSVEIEFTAGDTSLNRNPDYLYTLFVPDRARTAFPVFDQPNLKATYTLSLDLPASWVALGNGLLERVEVSGDGARKVHHFAPTDRLSSYLFSFVAGEFETVTRIVDGREMTLLHRETDAAKVARNIDEIFDAHAEALAWLEAYTGIDYPFQKFDFAAIPTFQYGGMEHVGAIQYRASTLFLDESPSDPQLLNRANLIAHETAHMWFGDLVTMDWFDDVWTKEVFANFMAAKIVNPEFPDIDHDLNFLLRSYPAAYAVDRTTGANPIRQPLANLNEAGTLYGGIIYNKAPIMMRQLERLVGPEVFQEGMREYLATFAGANATWPDLIEILDKRSDEDLKAWSEVWVTTPGRPHYELSEDGRLRQIDPAGEGRFWTQRFELFAPVKGLRIDSRLAGLPEGVSFTDDVLVNSQGDGYGLFPVNVGLAETAWPELSDLQKGAQLVNLYEQMLEGHDALSPARYAQFLLERIEAQDNELLLNAMLGQLRRTYWSFLTEREQAGMIADMEALLWRGVDAGARPASTRKIYLRTLQDVALSAASLDRLGRVLSGAAEIDGITLSPRERGQLAALLALKRPEAADAIVDAHIASLENPDARRRYEFLKPALSLDEGVRDAFFASLKDVRNRAIESWVVDALGYLHHPLRVDSSQRYIRESLELMEEIQVTGDIFFPARWSAQVLQNHHGAVAAGTVRTFLAERPDYNYQLRLKILQSADPLYRAEQLRAR